MKRPEEYEVLMPMLVDMKELADLLRAKRRQEDPLILIFRRPR